ncbi:MAG TPA: protein kinase [Polyangiaceae bacterium]
MPLHVGDRFDRYEIEELLGEGGMAQVYRAHDPRLNRRVALKVLRVDSLNAPDSASSASTLMMREARAAAALDHPNAVSVFDVGEADGEVFLAMELVVGKSLRAYVGDPAVPWDTKLRWMVDAARALGAAHERGLVHRDVKPENVMVRADGVVKVLDFGIAKRVKVDIASGATLDDPRSQSFLGGLVGTPWYLSPEQLRNEPVDGRADQFAWGVMTYELLTGVLPWPKGVDGFQLVLAILNTVPDPPSKLLKPLPSIVDATIMKALAKAPSQRFEAMEFVVTALEGIVAASRRSWATVTASATTKTDPAPAPEAPAPQQRTDLAFESALAGRAARDGATTQPSRRPSARPPTLRRPALVAAGAMAAAAVLAFVSARLTRAPAPAAAASASPAPSLVPTAITDVPPPVSGVPEAIAAYRTYQQRLRDADWRAAREALEDAVGRDPTMAAAQLRLAYMQSLQSADEGHVRATFMLAERHRGTLDERDAALLDALEPYLRREPSDPAESQRRLEAIHARWPLDAEVAYVLGSVRFDRGDFAQALEAMDAAIAIDPAFAQAWSTKGGVLAYLGRLDDARAALEEASHRSRTATEPLWYEAEIAEQQGRCADEEAATRQWLSRDPDDWFAYQYLASSLAAEGKPVDTVRTALEQKWVREAADERARREPIDLAELDVLAGDFASAEARLDELEKRLATEPGAQAHAESQLLLLRIAEESGQNDRVRAVATSYLARKDAWAPPHRVDEVSMFLDPVPEMLGALSRVGAIDAGQLDRQRGDWLAAWRAKTSAAYLGYLWVAGWAAPATTRDQAEAALRALPDFGALPRFVPTFPTDMLVGRTYRLAGRTDDAIAFLRRGVAACTMLGEGVRTTRASFELAQALETAGDTSGACDAYRVVLARWGHAKPRSVTADRARTRSTALACH